MSRTYCNVFASIKLTFNFELDFATFRRDAQLIAQRRRDALGPCTNPVESGALWFGRSCTEIIDVLSYGTWLNIQQSLALFLHTLVHCAVPNKHPIWATSSVPWKVGPWAEGSTNDDARWGSVFRLQDSKGTGCDEAMLAMQARDGKSEAPLKNGWPQKVCGVHQSQLGVKLSVYLRSPYQI
jgi:hypothetical protein